MKRVVILGPGGAGKSTFARRLGAVTGLPVIELDQLFWGPTLVPLPSDQWSAMQQELVAQPSWILDGDLGPYDVVHIRISAADTIVVLDFPLWRCLWRVVRRSRERWDFWRWLVRWRRDSRPALLSTIATYAPAATLHLPRNPAALHRLETELARDPD